MGAINVGASVYGAVRGAQDAEKFDMEKQGFESDQAIRRQRLEDDRATAPLRRRAIQLGVDDAEHAIARRPALEARQDELSQLGIDEARYNAKEREELRKRATEARGMQDLLRNGLRDFMGSGDPQHVADAFGKTDPKRAGTKAERKDDGSIELTNPNAKQPLIFRNIKKDGQEITADEQLQHFVLKMADPLESLKQEVATEQKTKIEGAKQTAITARTAATEATRAESRRTAAESKADRERGRRVTSELRTVTSEVLSGLKTSSIPGHFANVYSSDDDAKLVPAIKDRASAIYKKAADDEDDDMTPAKAARQAIEETRMTFVTHKKAATDASAKLLAKGIDPTDRDQVAAAMKAGNADAKTFVEAIGKVNKDLGPDAAKYLFDQTPRKKK